MVQAADHSNSGNPRRDFQRVWEGWDAGFMAFHAFHTLSFPWPAFRAANVSKPNAAIQCNVPHSTRDAHRYSSLVNKCIGDLSSNESRSFRDRRFLGLILWNSLWGEFISIPKEVIGMATTCKDKSRAVPKVIRSGV